MQNQPKLHNYDLIMFDLDDTLAETKSPLSTEMAQTLTELLNSHYVGIISGGDWSQFQKQVIAQLPAEANLYNLCVAPTIGSKLYLYRNDEWQLMYADYMPAEDKQEIYNALNEAIEKYDMYPEQQWGDLIEDRTTLIAYSALGQEAPKELKKAWDPDKKKRKPIADLLIDRFADKYAISMNGSTTIDILPGKIDKAYGVENIMNELEVTKDQVIFFGDSMQEGGNDYPVKQTGIATYEVTGPSETLQILKAGM